METTKLSSKGQVIIPKELRDQYNWKAGLEFVVIDMGDGIILKPKRPFAQTNLTDVAGILAYEGRTISQEEMEQAIREGIEQTYGRR